MDDISSLDVDQLYPPEQIPPHHNEIDDFSKSDKQLYNGQSNP